MKTSKFVYIQFYGFFWQVFSKTFWDKVQFDEFWRENKKVTVETFLLIFQHCVVFILLTSKDVAEEGDASDRPVKRSKGSGMTKKFCFHYFSYLY